MRQGRRCRAVPVDNRQPYRVLDDVRVALSYSLPPAAFQSSRPSAVVLHGAAHGDGVAGVRLEPGEFLVGDVVDLVAIADEHVLGAALQHASTHCWSVIFFVPCSPSACFALHMASLIWPFHESAAITGATVIATVAASAAHNLPHARPPRERSGGPEEITADHSTEQGRGSGPSPIFLSRWCCFYLPGPSPSLVDLRPRNTRLFSRRLACGRFRARWPQR